MRDHTPYYEVEFEDYDEDDGDNDDDGAPLPPGPPDVEPPEDDQQGGAEGGRGAEVNDQCDLRDPATTAGPASCVILGGQQEPTRPVVTEER